MGVARTVVVVSRGGRGAQPQYYGGFDGDDFLTLSDGSGPTDASLRLHLGFTDGPGSSVVTDLAIGNHATITGMTWQTV